MPADEVQFESDIDIQEAATDTSSTPDDWDLSGTAPPPEMQGDPNELVCDGCQ